MAHISADLIAAKDDPDIEARLIALGRVLGAQESDIRNALPVLAAAPVDNTGSNTIASVLAYARATYTPTPRPGQNPAAVTDAHLEYALRAVPGLIPGGD